MSTRPRWLLPVTLVALATAALSEGSAGAQDMNAMLRELADIEADAEQMAALTLRRERLRSATHVEERLTDGELFYRLQDYLRAAVIFTDIVDNYPDHPSLPDASFLLADSLFRAGDYLGARTRFREIIERSDRASFQPYVQRALGRLIEIAIHIRDFDGVDSYFDRLSRLPPSEVEAATAYFRAKYLYNRAVPLEIGRRSGPLTEQLDANALEEARQAFEAVSERSPYYSQARYFIGVVLTLQGQLPQAIQSFQRVLTAEVATDEQRAVAELAHLALGRLQYEVGALPEAVTAYESIPRSSPHFDTALFELAWVFIRMGDGTRAEQALEVLAIATPTSMHIPDAQLLRGNLLLREGRFDDAEEVFAAVAAEFGPIREELDQMVSRRPDPQRYFCQLVRDNMTLFDVHAFLPAEALRWSEPSPEMERAMDTLSDLAQARQLVEETGAIVHRMGRALEADNRVNVFSDLRMHRERTVALRNRLITVRQQLMAQAERAVPGSADPRLAEARQRRKEIEPRIAAMPRSTEQIEAASTEAHAAFDALSKELNRLEVELMGMEARIVATDRFVAQSFQEAEQAEGVAAYQQELASHRNAISDYRERIRVLALDVEAGRLRVGIGDESFKRDAALRSEYEGVVEQERQLVLAMGGDLGGQLNAAFARVQAAEAKLNSHDAQVDEVANERVSKMQVVLDEESVKLDGYRAQLKELEGTTEDVVGGIAYESFRQTQRRFYDLVLRADVGTIDVAWARREEHRMRVENLTKDRNAAVSALDGEFAEIMDQEQGAKP